MVTVTGYKTALDNKYKILKKNRYFQFDFVTFETLILNWFKLETVNKAHGWDHEGKLVNI